MSEEYWELYVRDGAGNSTSLHVAEDDISTAHLAPGQTQIYVQLSPMEIEELEKLFGEDADLQTNLNDEFAWHKATLGAHELRWWAGYR